MSFRTLEKDLADSSIPLKDVNREGTANSTITVQCVEMNITTLQNIMPDHLRSSEYVSVSASNCFFASLVPTLECGLYLNELTTSLGTMYLCHSSRLLNGVRGGSYC